MLYQEKKVNSILNPTGGFLKSFTHSLNPYGGCAFGAPTTNGEGCPFCYVRELPVAKYARARWGEWVTAKINGDEALRQQLKKLADNGELSRLRIFMGTSTDSYQGIERRLQLTRRILEVFTDFSAIGVLVVQTRSPMIERDVDLLQALGKKVWVSFTLETDDDQVRRLITPTSPSVERRLRTLEKLTRSGIQTQCAISPRRPNNAERFAELLKDRCTRALVDTFEGDGAGGKRTEKLGIPKLYKRLGYGSWLARDSYLPLLEALRRALGEERVVFSQDGFNDV